MTTSKARAARGRSRAVRATATTSDGGRRGVVGMGPPRARVTPEPEREENRTSRLLTSKSVGSWTTVSGEKGRGEAGSGPPGPRPTSTAAPTRCAGGRAPPGERLAILIALTIPLESRIRPRMRTTAGWLVLGLAAVLGLETPSQAY